MKVLIVGGGIAGDALALLLDRAGWAVTVAEIAPELRGGGQTVDLRGTSAAVLDRMGLLEACRAKLVPQSGIAWVNGRGNRIGAMPVTAFDGQGFVSSEELLRSDLAQVLHNAGGPAIRRWFGETVTALDEQPDGVRVAFRGHEPEAFDLVVGADGIHSRVRELVFGPEEQFRKPLGLAHAWFTIRETPATPRTAGWSIVHQAPGCRSVGARPGHDGEQEIGFSFPATTLPARGDRDAQFALLRKNFHDVGWRAAELLEAAPNATDFALDTFDQIHVGRWHRGRVALLGDAAWCASPLSGLGTALALLGAHVLATTLGKDPDLTAALTEYDAVMRPRTDAAAELFPGRVRMYAPKTRIGIVLTAKLMNAVQHKPIATRLMRGAEQYQRSDLPEGF